MSDNLKYDGKLHCVYLQTGATDLTGDDATILANADWSKLCVMESEDDVSRNFHNIEDTCTGFEEQSLPKSRKRTIKGDLYLFRVADGTVDELVRELESAVEDDSIIMSVLRLSAARDSTKARGSIGNYYLSKFTEKSSASDLIKVSVEFEPAVIAGAEKSNRFIRSY